MVLDRLCTVLQTVLLVAVGSHACTSPAERQSFRFKWGAACWGENTRIFSCLAGEHSDYPPEGHSRQLASLKTTTHGHG
jgi:hypothetical protein